MKVCVVGNSNRLLDANYGEFIDSCDVVIRMNRFKLDSSLSKHTGNKIDIISIRATGEGISKELADYIPTVYFQQCTKIWIPVPKRFYTEPTENRFFDLRPDVDINKLEFASYPEYSKTIMDLLMTTGHYSLEAWDEDFLTTGYHTVCLAEQRYPSSEIYIVGFDPLSRKEYTHYWLPEILPRHRHLALEAIMLQKKIENKKIIPLMEI